MTGDGEEDEVGMVEEGEEPARVTNARKRRREEDVEAQDETRTSGPQQIGGVSDEDRLHASFVRFCEEARMLGLVRARGKGVGRRGDEVVKSVTLV
jgi:hypothetical protein